MDRILTSSSMMTESRTETKERKWLKNVVEYLISHGDEGRSDHPFLSVSKIFISFLLLAMFLFWGQGRNSAFVGEIILWVLIALPVVSERV